LGSVVGLGGWVGWLGWVVGLGEWVGLVGWVVGFGWPYIIFIQT
jgi:hypothetical protein